jgi:hypothetical protein
MKFSKGLFTLLTAFLLPFLAGTGEAALITTPTTMPVSATVNNDISIAISGNSLGHFSVVGHATDTATASIAPSGATTSDIGTGAGLGSAQAASFVWSPSSPPQTPTITLSSGFTGAGIIINYDNVVNLTCANGSTIRITHITDNLSTPGLWDKPGPGAPTASAGRGTLNGAGALIFNIGLTLATTAGEAYTSGACNGSFEFMVEYG